MNAERRACSSRDLRSRFEIHASAPPFVLRIRRPSFARLHSSRARPAVAHGVPPPPRARSTRCRRPRGPSRPAGSPRAGTCCMPCRSSTRARRAASPGHGAPDSASGTRFRTECRAPQGRHRAVPGTRRPTAATPSCGTRSPPSGGRASTAPSRAPPARAARSDGRSGCRGGSRRGRSPSRRRAECCCGNHSISRSIAGIGSVSDALYWRLQRSIWRAK